MGFSAVYNTDVGIKKKTNQDSLAIKIADTPNGQVVFSLVCDGMGGLAKGEVASKEVITAFCNWFDTQFVEMVDNNSFSEELLRYQWIRMRRSRRMASRMDLCLVRPFLRSSYTEKCTTFSMLETAECMRSLQG